jgi:hypothetical protein
MNLYGNARLKCFFDFRIVTLFHCAVSLKVATGWPKPYCPSAVTVTGPGEAGRVRVTEAMPELLVTATTLLPLVVPFESNPALAVNKTLPPAAEPPDAPGARVTVNKFANVLPALPDCPLPVVVNEAAGFPTTIQPLWLVFAELSVPGTE